MKDTIKLLWTIFRKKRALAEINLAIEDVKVDTVEALMLVEEYHQLRAIALDPHIRQAFTRRCVSQQIKVDQLQDNFAELMIAKTCLEIQISEASRAFRLVQALHELRKPG